jgi:hypothetical protein
MCSGFPLVSPHRPGQTGPWRQGLGDRARLRRRPGTFLGRITDAASRGPFWPRNPETRPRCDFVSEDQLLVQLSLHPSSGVSRDSLIAFKHMLTWPLFASPHPGVRIPSTTARELMRLMFQDVRAQADVVPAVAVNTIKLKRALYDQTSNDPLTFFYVPSWKGFEQIPKTPPKTKSLAALEEDPQNFLQDALPRGQDQSSKRS